MKKVRYPAEFKAEAVRQTGAGSLEQGFKLQLVGSTLHRNQHLDSRGFSITLKLMEPVKSMSICVKMKVILFFRCISQ